MEKVDYKLQKRQLELMKKRFDVDEENKIVKIDLFYDKADDILESNLDTKVPTFDRDKFGRIKELISDFPREYRADLNIKIDDYQDYKPQEILEGFNDAVELTHYSGNREHKKKWIQITFLLIAGILILFILAQGLIESWFSLGEVGASVVKEAVDITSWVFIWEAVSLLFLSPSEDRIVSLTLAYRLRDVALLDSKGEVLAKENYRDSYANTAQEKPTRILGKYALLISGAAFFGIGVSRLVSYFVELPHMIQMGWIYTFIFSLLDLGVVSFEVFGGLAAMSAFTGRGTKLYKLTFPFGILTFIFEAFTFAISIAYRARIVVATVGLLVSLAYLVGVILIKVTNEKKPKSKK